jgi:hypothetical protein
MDEQTRVMVLQTYAPTWSPSVDTTSPIVERLLVATFLACALCSAPNAFAADAPLQLKQDGFDAERSAVRSVLGSDVGTIEASNGQKAAIFVARTDLDGDSTDEIVARVVHGGYCGSGGCLMLVLRRDAAGAWHTISETTAVEITVASEQTRGFHDLIVKDGHEQVHRLAWDGERYSGARPPAR